LAAQALQWPAFDGLRDQPEVLLAHEPQTYTLVGEMLDCVSSVFTSRRVHIGSAE
jgi:hypothetical protein